MQENHYQRMKRKINLIWIVLTLVVVVTAIFLMSLFRNGIEQENGVYDPELALAMSYGEFTEDDFKTDTDFVRFGAFFLRDLDDDGYAERVKGTCKAIGESDTLYMSLNVLTEGVLKDGKIEIDGKNFCFQTTLVGDDVIDGNYVGANTNVIELKDVGVGTQKLIFGNVRSGDYSSWNTVRSAIGENTGRYSMVNSVVFTGTLVKNNGEEIEIKKVINIPVDWYSETVAAIPVVYKGNVNNKYQIFDVKKLLDLENGVISFDFNLVSQETKNRLLLSKAVIEGEIPNFNGYEPLSVEILGENVQFEYDDANHTFRAWRDANIGGNGYVYEEAYSGVYGQNRYNEFEVFVTYSVEAYSLDQEIDEYRVNYSAFYEGFNNPNDEFDNPYVSNVASDFIVVDFDTGYTEEARLEVSVGKYIQKPYDAWVVSKERARTEDIEYEVKWAFGTGYGLGINGIKLYENSDIYGDQFVYDDGSVDSMIEESEIVGLYFTGLGTVLGDGDLRIYDNDSNELLGTLSVSELESLNNRDNIFSIGDGVKHLRFEMDNVYENGNGRIIFVKKINSESMAAKYSDEDVARMVNIKSSAVMDICEDGDVYERSLNKIGTARYDREMSLLTFDDIDVEYLSTQEIRENVVLSFSTVHGSYNVSDWSNGSFLIKFPDEILLASINDVSISNPDVEILGYDFYDDDGIYYLRILTENVDRTVYTISVDCNIIPDPRVLSSTVEFELMGYNEACDNYLENYRTSDLFDLDNDSDVDEFVGFATKGVIMVGPSSLITTEIAKEYNKMGDILETSVAPQVAVIDKVQDDKSAKIVVDITNNYAGNISDVVVVGKIPFEGNSTVINDYELGSTFDAVLRGEIVVPEEIRDYCTIYYSYNEDVSKDLLDESNGWISENVDFSRVKSYLIDFGDYVIPTGEHLECYYEIEIPDSVNYNDVAYSTHAVYFALETNEGKYRDSTETNKLGIMIARKFDFGIENVRFNYNDTKIDGTYFSLSVEGESGSRILTTNENGRIDISDLYVEKVYVVKEVKASRDYVINDHEFKFKVVVIDGELRLEILSDEDDSIELDLNGDREKISVFVENLPKYSLNGLKVESSSGEPIQAVRFRIFGKGISKTGRTMTTNAKGEFSIDSLYPYEVYILVEEYAKGYSYSEQEIKFVARYEDGKFAVFVDEGKFAEGPIVTENIVGQNGMNVKIENTALENFSVVLTKFAADEEIVLSGAKYRVSGEWMNQEFATDENGELFVNGLYEGVDYEIKETFAPNGYVLDESVINLNVNVENGEIFVNGKDNGVRDYEVVGNVLKINVEDEPLFKLIKKDGTTGEALPNVSFAISKIDEDYNESEAKDSKGNVVGELVNIDGTDYRVVKTNENGVILEDLEDGIYKVIEVDVDEAYQLALDVDDRTYYFGIGKGKDAVREMVQDFEVVLAGKDLITWRDVKNTDDGGFVRVGSTANDITFGSSETASGKEIVVDTTNYNNTGIIVKYDKDGKIEWASHSDYLNDRFPSYANQYIQVLIDDNKNYVVEVLHSTAGTNHSRQLVFNQSGTLIEDHATIDDSTPHKICRTKDGGYVESGTYWKKLIVSADNMVSGEEYRYEKENTDTDVYIIKMNSEFKVEWVRRLSGARREYYKGLEVDDEGNIIGAMQYEEAPVIISGEETIDGNEISIGTGEYCKFSVMYVLNEDGKYTMVKEYRSERVNVGRYIKEFTYMNGYYYASATGSATDVVIPAEDISTNKSLYVGSFNYLVKYRKDGIIDSLVYFDMGWGSNFTKIVPLSNGDYVLYGYIYSDTTITGKRTVSGENIELKVNDDPDYSYKYDILIMRVNSDDKVIWAKSFGSKINDTEDATIRELDDGKIELATLFSGKTEISGELMKTGESMILNGSAIITFDEDGLIENIDSRERLTTVYKDSIISKNAGGYVSVGYFVGGFDFNDETIYSVGSDDSIIVKYDDNQNMEWVHTLCGSWTDNYTSVIEVEDGYLVTGFTLRDITIPAEDTVNNEEIYIYNANRGYYGLIVKYTFDGKVEYVKSQNGGTVFKGIMETENGYDVWGSFEGTIVIKSENTVKDEGDLTYSTKGRDDAIFIRYDKDWKVDRVYVFQGDDTESFYNISECNGEILLSLYSISSNLEFETVDGINSYDMEERTLYFVRIDSLGDVRVVDVITGGNGGGAILRDDGKIVAVIHNYGNLGLIDGDLTRITGGGNDIYLIEYDVNGNCEKLTRMGSGTSYASKFIDCGDDGYISRSTAGSTFTIYKENTVSGEKIVVPGGREFLMKFNRYGKVEYAFVVGLSNETLNVEKFDNEYVISGKVSDEYSNNAKFLKVTENLISAEIPEQQLIEIVNYKKRFNIITEVEVDDGEKGGSISGEDDEPYEIVEWGDDNEKEIKIIPDVGYKIAEIRVNDQNISFIPDVDGSVVLDKFEDIKENKNIVVKFGDNISNVIVHHYIDGTTAKVAEDDLLVGRVGNQYSTSPKGDLEDYIVIAEKIPSNASGVYDENVEEVIFYYKKKEVKLIVNYYMVGTTERISDENYEEYLEKGEEYSSRVAGDVDEKYELVGMPDNASGVANEDVVVNYYYKIKKFDVYTRVDGDGGTISGNSNESFENIEYGQNSQKDIWVVPDEGYEIESIVINGVEIDFIVDENGSVSLDKFIYVLEDKEIVVKFGRIVGKVIVHHYLVGTEEAVSDDEVKSGYVGEIFATKQSDSILDKYEIVEIPEVSSGKYSKDDIEIIYYYGLKDSSVLVHHYIYGTEEKLAEDELIEGKVDDNYSTSVSDEIESKWELAVVPENRTGVMTVDQIEVTYYYRKKPAKVIVHYYEEGTVNKLSEDKVIEARVDDEYKTEAASDVPVKYEFSYVDGEPDGNMTEEDIEIIYYYRVKDTDLVVRYLEQGTDEVLHEENRQSGKVDEDYITSSLEIDGYEVVAHSGNENGKLGLETTYVTYYYLYKTKASVEYIDITTGEVLESRSEDGLEGDEFVTEAKNFDEYVLLQEPNDKSVKMTKEEQVLRYYYVHVAAGVIEKHIDNDNGEILYNEVHEGIVGDDYEIKSKENDEGFEKYDLVVDELPDNASGKMTDEVIEVKYYYIKRSNVNIKYVDKNTGEEIAEAEFIEGHRGDEYETYEKKIDDYKLINVPDNAEGIFGKDDIEVVYYYVRRSAGVVEEHIDVISGEKIIDDERYDGYEGDKYKIEAKTNEDEGFEKYVLVQDKLPENAEGEMSNEEIVVTYYYRKKSSVTIRYVDKNTGEEIGEPEVKEGLEDEEYTSNEKIVDGYELAKEPEDKNGKFGSDDKEIVYYYVRPAKVVVNYLEMETGEELAESEVIDGYEGEEYHTEAKEVEYYKLEKEPENKDGIYIVYDIDDGENDGDVDGNDEQNEENKWIVVNYYYIKKEFNLNMDKKIVDILVNDTSVMNGDGEFAKVELNSKNLENSDVVVKYEIAVENDSEIAGSAILEENIPDRMKMVQSENEKWNVGTKNATLITEEIEPGEKKFYEVTMRWIAGGDSIGTISNIARIAKTENGARFEEVTEKDNEDMADVVISIETGLGDENDYTIIYGMTLMAMMIFAGATVVTLKKHN